MRMTPEAYRQMAARNAGQRGATLRYAEPELAQSVRLVLPMPPSVNHSTGPRGDGGRYLTAEHKQFRQEVALRVVAAGRPQFGTQRIELDITLVPADRRRFDISNRIKALEDALQLANVFADDEQIDKLVVSRAQPMLPGESACVVVIKAV